jgi:hypothetical protein
VCPFASFANLHVLSFGAENGYLDISIDDDGFVLSSGEYEHGFLLPWFKALCQIGAIAAIRERRQDL